MLPLFRFIIPGLCLLSIRSIICGIAIMSDFSLGLLRSSGHN